MLLNSFFANVVLHDHNILLLFTRFTIESYMLLCFLFNRYAEFLLVKDIANLVKLPDTLPLDVAAMLPCGGVMAYAAVQRAKPFVQEKLSTTNGKYYSLKTSTIITIVSVNQ